MDDTPGIKKTLYQTTVTLTASELQAVEAWRQAQDIPEQADALRRLVQQGLLTEIRGLYENSEDISLELMQKVSGRGAE